ncbi:hypothetical protein AWC19_24150 [Mycobacterium palustre]|uniref:Short-chain dehydrogenase n=1 Tax=Mycobacterium palustre TaxID=153971 RepID=A0A1X2A0C5_9MYCO|nr:hypothetical protein AWC19_24150 [Mycobacterium palustre]
MVNDIDGDAAQQVVHEICERGGHAVLDDHDIVHDPVALVATAIDAFGRLDVLINNAGVLGVTAFGDVSAESWDKVFDSLIKGPVGVTRASWKHLLQSDAGKVVNVSSVGMLGNPGFTAYGAGKAAVFGFTKSLALEAIGTNVTVNCILPSAWTRMSEAIPDPLVRDVLQKHFQPEHVSSFVAWLAHPANRINNEAFEVGAGRASRVRLGVGPGVQVTTSDIDAWFQQQDKLMASGGELTPVDTSTDLFGLEVARAVEDLNLQQFTEKPVQFDNVEFQ